MYAAILFIVVRLILTLGEWQRIY